MTNKPSINIPVIFQNVKEYENEDSRFLKLKIWLMHTGTNLNASSFSKDVVEKAIPTLANTPLLAFIEEGVAGEMDFSDHRMVLHRNTEGDTTLKYLGSAIGVIPEDNNARWETRVTDSGEELEYLVVDALMWSKWDEPINIMKSKGFTSQSMELSDDYSGTWDDNNIFHFESFKFFGACLLGEDVMPAMNSSIAEIQFSKNKDMQKDIEEKLNEFYTLFSHHEQKGGNESMTKETKQEDVKVVSDYEKTEVEFETNPEATDVPEEQPENDSPSDNPEEATKDSDTHEDDSSAEHKEDDTESQDKPEEEKESEPEVDYQAKFNEVSAQLADLQTDYSTLQSELADLKSYKRQREEDDLKAKFEGKLSDEEFAQVFTDMKESDLDKVEEKLFALIGKKNFSIESTKKSDKEVNRIDVVIPEEKTVLFGGIFD